MARDLFAEAGISLKDEEEAKGRDLFAEAGLKVEALKDEEEAKGRDLFAEAGLKVEDVPLEPAERPKRTVLGTIGDVGVTALKGAVGLPQAFMGLADIVSGGQAGKDFEDAGLRFSDAQKILDGMYSPAQQAASREVQKAEGFMGTLNAAIDNPSVIATTVGESLPQMLGGAAIARGGLALTGRLAPWAAGAIGEGLMGAGSAAEQLRSESPDGLLTGKQTASAVASGIGTAAIGAAAGKFSGSKLGQRLGVSDVDTMLAAGKFNKTPAGFFKQVLGSGISEGVFEELPQSIQEQMWQNYAQDRPIDEGVGKAGALGMLAGLSMGGVGGGFNAAQASPSEGQGSAPSPAPDAVPPGGRDIDVKVTYTGPDGKPVTSSTAGATSSAVASIDKEIAQAEARWKELATAGGDGPMVGVERAALEQEIADLRAEREAKMKALTEPAGNPAASSTGNAPANPSVATADTTEAEAALRTPVVLTALDRADAIGGEVAAINTRLAMLTPENGYGPAFDQERQELAAQAAELEGERAGIAATWPKAVRGAPTAFSTEAGAKLEAEYALMDAADLVTSHTESLRANPLYPQELQPRDRSRNASEMQVSGIVQKLDPARLGLSADAGTGAPIVGADGLVESGNARTIAMKRVYQANGQKAADYKQFLRDNAAQFGLTPEAVESMEKPVLVRVRSTPVNRAEFARQANASTVQRMSPSEQALSDARRLNSLDGLNPTEDGEFSNSMDFIRQFMATLPITEQSDLIESDGRLSTAGYRRIQNAVLARAYGDSPSLRRMTESMDNNLLNVSKALLRVAPTIAAARERMQAGTMHEADIAPDLLAAVEGLSALKEKGWTVAQELAQVDLTGPKYTPEAAELLGFLSDNMRSPRRIAEFFQRYYEALEQAGDPSQPSMFGDDGPAPARTDLLKKAKGVQDGDTAQNPERGINREGQEAAAQDGRQSEDAPGSRRGDQGDGPAGSEAGGEQPGQPQGETEGLTAPTRADIEAQQDRAAQSDKLDEREQVRKESEAGADSFTLTTEEGRQDTTGNLLDQSAEPGKPDAGLKFSRSAAAEVRNLVTLHNLTEDNLAYADQMGGIPVPSIGITKVDTPFSGFGNITLIAPKQMIDPKNGVPVYDRDAWTARFPTLNFKKVKTKLADAFYERMKPVRDLMAGDDDGFISQLWDRLRNASVQSPEKIIELFQQYDAGRVMYAKEVLGKSIKIPTKAVTPREFFAHEKPWLDFAKSADWSKADLAANDPGYIALRQEAGAAAKAAAEAYIAKKVAARAKDAENAGKLHKIYADLSDGLVDEDGLLNDAVMGRARRDAGTVGTKSVDMLKLREAVEKTVKRDDPGYLRWVQSLVQPLFEAPTITLRGKEVPATLDNIVATMTVGVTVGAEKSMTFSPGKVAAMLGKKFKSLDEIKAARDQVVSQQAETESKKAADALLEEYRTHVSQFYTGKDWRGNIDTWAANDDAMEALAKAGKMALEGANIRSALARMGFKGVDLRAIDLARQSIDALRNASTDYFEAKPQRAVTLDEFRGAVVPKGASPEAIAILEKHGIAVEMHAKTEGAREKAIQKLAKRLDKERGDVLFSRTPATKAAYEERIDALFAGEKAGSGTRVLDRSDMMGLLGFPNAPLLLGESHLLENQASHPEMTAEQWKKVPQWLDNPAATYEDRGRIVMLAPDTVAGYPVRMVIEPSPTASKRGQPESFQLLVTVFAKTTPPHAPNLQSLADGGSLRYLDTKTAPEIWKRAGAKFPRQVSDLRSRVKILTEKHLAGYRRANNTSTSFADQPKVAVGAPVSAIRQAIEKAYGKLLSQLEAKGLVTLTQTQEQAIEAAAKSRAAKGGGDVAQIKLALMESVKNSAAMRLWVGSRTVNDAIVPETPEYAGSTTGDLAYVPQGVGVAAGPIRVPVGVARAAHEGFGVEHLADNARRDPRRAPPAATGNMAEDLMRQVVSVLGDVSTVHRDGSAYVFASQRTGKAIVAKWNGAHYAVVTVRPFNGAATSLWGIPEWRGRLAFPPHADAETAPSTASHQVNNPRLERDGQEVVSEKFNLTSDTAQQQVAPKVTIKKQRKLDIKRSANGAIQGFFDPQTGQSFLIADNLSAEAAPGVLMHEVGIHMAADGSMKALFQRAKMMLKSQGNSPFMRTVQAKMDAAGETSGEEAAAYIAETYENDRANAPATVKSWLADLLAAVKAWMHRKGIIGADSLTVADIAAVARANAKSMTQRAADVATYSPVNRVQEVKRDGYTRDLFGGVVDWSPRTEPTQQVVPGNVQPAADVPGDTPAPAGDYRVRTIVGTQGERRLGASRIQSLADLAAATQYLYRSAVERFDGIVTDKDGKPLAVVGGFKGALSQASVYPATLMGEAVRVPGAAHIWFAHNHPSGSAGLSRADMSLEETLRDVFVGTGIKPMGLIAIGDGKFDGVTPTSAESGEVRKPLGDTRVPVIERELPTGIEAPSTMVDSPSEAKRVAAAYYNQAKQPGIVLLDAGLRVNAWVPLPSEMMGNLRETGQLRALYRAISESNAGAAILAHGGELDAIHPSSTYITIGQNIGAALNKIDVRPLDIINANTGKSAAERADKLAAGPVFSRASAVAGQAKAKLDELLTPKRMDTFIYNIQDKLIDLKRLREHIRALNGTVTDLNDAYQGEELYHGRVARNSAKFLETEVKPLLMALRNQGYTVEQLEQYLHARHAPEANRVLAERNPNASMIAANLRTAMAEVRDLERRLGSATNSGASTKALEDALEIAREQAQVWKSAEPFRGTEEERLSLSGMSDAEAGAYMSGLTVREASELGRLAAKVDAIQRGTTDALVDYGLQDKASIAAWNSTYQHYVPLHRDEAHAEGSSHPIGQGFSVRGEASKRRTGSNEKVTNILSHIVMQRESALTRGEKNLVAKQLYLMARQNPAPDWWSTDKATHKRTVDKATGLVHTTVDPMYRTRDNAVVARINGKEVAIVFNERNERAMRLARALKNLDGSDLPYVLNLSAKVTRYFSAINTQYNPVFGVVNFTRDTGSVMLNMESAGLVGSRKGVLSALPSAYREIWREARGKTPVNQTWADLWSQLREDGGTTGYRELFRLPQDRADALKAELTRGDSNVAVKAGREVLNLLENYNDAMENATRLAVYKMALEQGMSRQKAASVAKNITVNFNRKGAMSRHLGALYAFFNAAVQGQARMLQTLSGPSGKKIMLGGVALGAINTLLGAMAMGGGEGEDDEWARIPDFIKTTSIVIPTSRTTYVAIPMPLGFNVFPNLGRIATEWALDLKDKSSGEHAMEMMMALVDAFNPLGGGGNPVQTLTPTVFDPAVALLQNKDWKNVPIYQEDFNSLDPTPGHMRTKESASVFSKGAARVVNSATGGTDYTPGWWSPTPDQFDFIIGQLTGGVGREAMKATMTVTAPMSGEELPLHKIPLVGRLAGSTAGPSAGSSQFYDNVRKLNILENEEVGLLENDGDLEKFERKNPAVELIGDGKQAYQQVRDLRKDRIELVKEGLPGYQDEVKAIDAEIDSIMRDLNRAMDDVRKRGPAR